MKLDTTGEDKVLFYDGSAGHAKWCIGDWSNSSILHGKNGPIRHAQEISTGGAKVPQRNDWQTSDGDGWEPEPELSLTGRLTARTVLVFANIIFGWIRWFHWFCGLTVVSHR